MRQLKITNKITNRESVSLEKYLNDIAKLGMLTPEQEAEYARRIREGDEEALEVMCKSNLRFVVSVKRMIAEEVIGLLTLAMRKRLLGETILPLLLSACP